MRLFISYSLISAVWAMALTGARAAEINTNAAHFADAPKWLTARRVEKVTDAVQRVLEWDIRRVNVKWYSDQAEFQKAHGYDASVLAVSKRADNTIHVGPKVTPENFDGVFGHELAHVIMFQKYKDAIPKWLEEGLANYAAKRGVIDYRWLDAEPRVDVKTLEHPFSSTSANGAKYHYMASSALMEMIKSKCSIADLLQLAVGQKLESYLGTFCGIEDLNAEFDRWLKRKGAHPAQQ